MTTKIRLSTQAEDFCVEYRQRMHSARQPSLRLVVNAAVDVAVARASADKLSREDLKKIINDSTAISDTIVILKEISERIRDYMTRLGLSDEDFQNESLRSEIVSSCIIYCITKVHGYRHDVYRRAKIEQNPNQLWLPLNEEDYHLAEREAEAIDLRPVSWLSQKLRALFDAVRRMDEQQYRNFLTEIGNLATQFDAVGSAPHYLEIELPDVNLDAIQRIGTALQNNSRLGIEALKNAVARKAMRHS